MKRKPILLAKMLLVCIAFFTFSCKKEYTSYVQPEVTDTGKVVNNVITSKIAFKTVQNTFKKGDEMIIRLNRNGFEVREYKAYFESATMINGEQLIYCSIPNIVIGSGDSGSPLLTSDGKVAGVLCYGFSGSNHQFVARAIDDMLSITTTSKNQNEQVNLSKQGMQQIESAYYCSGIDNDFIARYKSRDSYNIISRFANFQTFNYTSNLKLTSLKSSSQSIIPGMSATVVEIYGDLTIQGATGTISYIDNNDNMYAFGHHYSENYAPLAAPVFLADTKMFVDSYLDSYKYSDISEWYIGAMTMDNYFGVVFKQSVDQKTFIQRLAVSFYGADSLIYSHMIANNTNTNYEYSLASYIPSLAIYKNVSTLKGKYITVNAIIKTQTSSSLLTDTITFHTLTANVDLDLYDVLTDRFVNYDKHIVNQQINVSIETSTFADSVLVPVKYK